MQFGVKKRDSLAAVSRPPEVAWWVKRKRILSEEGAPPIGEEGLSQVESYLPKVVE